MGQSQDSQIDNNHSETSEQKDEGKQEDEPEDDDTAKWIKELKHFPDKKSAFTFLFSCPCQKQPVIIHVRGVHAVMKLKNGSKYIKNFRQAVQVIAEDRYQFSSRIWMESQIQESTPSLLPVLAFFWFQRHGAQPISVFVAEE